MAEMKKQPQQASREAELTLLGTDAKSLRLLAETIPQIVWTANPDGQHDYYNPRWFAYTALTFEQTEGWGWLSALHPDDVRDCLTCWNEALGNGEPYEVEFRLKRASDNTYRWHLGKAGVIRNDAGQIVKWVGTYTDIDRQKQPDEELLNVRRQLEASVTQRTKQFEGANLFLKEQILERERVEKNLLKQTKIFASILDSMSEAVIVADADENFLIFNPAAERMFCMGPTPTTASDWSKRYGLFLPDAVTPFPAEQLPLARSIRGEDVDDLEMFVKPPKAPRGLWARVSGRPLRDSSGGSSGGVIVFRDITESKKEDAFRVGQGRILESIAAGVPLKDVLTNLMLLIEAQTEEMVCSVLLLSDDGDHVRHGAAPSLPEHYVRAVDGAPIGPKNGSCGTAMYRGKPVFVTDIFNDPLWEDYRELAAASGLRACWSTPILTRAGKVLGSFAMYYGEPRTPTGTEAKLTDVATHIAGIAIEHQRAEAALQRTQSELAHVSRVTTMGELAASIAHEVNQPLGAIVGNADICLQWLASDQPNLKQLREALEDITNDGRRASEVIARIRSLVKKTVAQTSLLDLNEVVNEVLHLLAHEAQRSRVALLTNLQDVPSVLGDRIQLQQVLLNLAMNAIDAMSDIKERKPELLVLTAETESGVLVSVKDCGHGIKPEDVDRVFRPFHTTKSGGMGMGLAISRSIIEKHGGSLWAEVNDDFGATFKFALPRGGNSES